MATVRVRMDATGIAHIHHLSERVTEVVTKAVEADASRFVPVDTGELRGSIHSESIGTRGRVFVGTDHWVYPEFGTRYMRAEPYMRPALYRKRVVDLG